MKYFEIFLEKNQIKSKHKIKLQGFFAEYFIQYYIEYNLVRAGALDIFSSFPKAPPHMSFPIKQIGTSFILKYLDFSLPSFYLNHKLR